MPHRVRGLGDPVPIPSSPSGRFQGGHRDAAPGGLSPRDLLLALLVVTVWGSNFVVVHWGLMRVPPLTLAALRFLFSALPAVFLVRRPNVSWRNLCAFGLTLGVGQFGLLFIAMRASITPALAALVLQMQAFFTLFLAAFLLRERLRAHNLIALAIAGSGILLIACRAGGFATATGLALVLLAALAWAICNLVARSAGTTHMLAYVAWSSLFAVPPLFGIALFVEGSDPLLHVFSRPDPIVVGVVFWQAAANTLLGYGLWNWLLNRYSAAQVAPLSLLVPVIATFLAWLLIGEALQGWKLLACVLILGGLAANQFGGRAAGGIRRLARRQAGAADPPASD